MSKVYLGDAVYADYDGLHVVLTVEYGLGPTETVYMDDQVYAALLRYVDGLRGVNDGDGAQ